ncbi:MAG: hypothetical protein GKR94_30635 [Gammaproteobacteria bacterium]|nr:hypothetical protein [Gammaproteobacteria bacterium]
MPQPGAPQRKRGIPAVIDRLIQPAIAQVLRWRWERQFHRNSDGLRPVRSAQHALPQAPSEITQGRPWAVDLDFDRFFDRVSHDRLMQTLKQDRDDPCRMRLLNRYLKAGIEKQRSS